MKKLVSSIVFAAIPLILSIFMLAFPARVTTILFFMIALYILCGALRELYVILKVDAIPNRLQTFSVVKNAVNIILSVILIFLSFSRPDIIMKVVVYIVAVDLLLTALSDTVDYIVLRRLGFTDILALDVVLRYVFSIIMFFFPSFISSTFIKIAAIIILIFSVLFMVFSVLSYRSGKNEIIAEYEEEK